MSAGNFDQPVTCSAGRAFSSMFASPNWTSNLLWLTIAALLQSFVVGSIFMLGYGANVVQSRAGLPGRNSPDIDSNRLSDYFMAGLWPFLVYFIASMVISIVVTIPLFIVFAILMAVAGMFGDAAGLVVVLLIVPLSLILSVLMAVFIAPITIRAMICQDFQKSFDIKWCTSFVRLTIKEVATSAILFGIMGVGVYLAGLVLFCVGVIPAMGLLSGAAMHLLSQWYELFLSRGGEPVPPPDNAVVDANLV